MRLSRNSTPSAFTLIELLVVIVIIAILAGLIFPVFARVQRSSLETRTLSHLRQIGAAIGTYSADHSDALPGPLSVEQYPIYGGDAKRDTGSLVKLLGPYLGIPEATDDKKVTVKESDIFACVGATYPKLEEVPGYIMNMEIVPDKDQPAWGVLGNNNDKPPLKRAALTAWRDTSNNDNEISNGTVLLGRKWAMRNTDQKDCDKLQLSGDWVEKLPKEPVFDDHYVALYFDLHAERLIPNYTNDKGNSQPNTDP
jgi:prepilin-type N-terminal cleavage/methylation domain-containing protein